MLLFGRRGIEAQWSKQQQKKKTAGSRAKARVVKRLLRRLEQKLSDEEVKATLGDYIRLVQFERELEEDEPREIKVTWVEPEATGSDSGK